MNPTLTNFCNALPALAHLPVVDVYRQALVDQGWDPALLRFWQTLPASDVGSEGVHAVTFRVGCDLAARVEEDAQWAYHNRTHAAEAVLAAGLLVGVEFEGQQCRKEAALVLLTAMVAHDLGHRGWESNAEVGAMEAWSAEESVKAWAPYGYPKAWQVAAERVRCIILGTEFSKAPPINEARMLANPEAWLPRLLVLANDADILASVLPGVGEERGHRLAEEWQQSGHPTPAAIATDQGRLGFLSHVRLRSWASVLLGAEEARKEQVHRLSTVSRPVSRPSL